MDKNKKALLKSIGFSPEFIAKLEEYQNNVIEIPSRDFSYEQGQYIIKDSANIFLEKSIDNTNTNLIVSSK